MTCYRFTDTEETITAQTLDARLTTGQWQPVPETASFDRADVYHIIDEYGDERILKRVDENRQKMTEQTRRSDERYREQVETAWDCRR